jgi:hypothetical protein
MNCFSRGAHLWASTRDLSEAFQKPLQPRRMIGYFLAMARAWAATMSTPTTTSRPPAD